MADTTSKATGTFTIKGWDEQPYAEAEGFVLRLDGGFEEGAASTRWTVVTGTGTGDLAGLEGEGGYVAKQGDPEVAYELRWTLG